ncbi:MAG: succinate dehydrogenase assembly factor 2 family protein [Xanthomonadales bacterium]|nr:succinate dehydrogenase assembly factor 2 family protein [Xanthomonadales bacterium]
MVRDGRLGRLKWLCRRGMKELDVMLEAFLERHRDALVAGEYPLLEKLLETEDDQLWDWLQGGAHRPPAEFTRLVAELRREP